MSSLRIAYVTTGRASDINNWSGLVVNIRQCLVREGHEVFDIDGVQVPTPWRTRFRGWYWRFVKGWPYGYDRDLDVARAFAVQVRRKLKHLQVDCIVSPRSYPLAFLETNIPMASWGDATFHCLQGLYPGFDRAAPISLRHGEELEQRALHRCRLLAYATQWAADDAIRHYTVDPEQVRVIPFGSNCTTPFVDADAARSAIQERRPVPLRLLFVGVEWERKGGPLALQVLQELHRRGVSAELWVSGCDPFQGSPPPGVRCLGFLSKSDPAQWESWQRCFLECHVFLMPTRAECFGVVYAEAAAYALPSLATRVGGVPDAAREDGGGFLFDLDTGPGPYADLLQSWTDDWAVYQEQSLRAWRTSQEILNWQVAGRRFSDCLVESMAVAQGRRQEH